MEELTMHASGDPTLGASVEWRVECDVTLADDETKALTKMNRRRGSNKQTSSGWNLIFLASAVGLAMAILFVTTGIVEPDHGGGVAVGGFLACWAGVWMYYGYAMHQWRKKVQHEWEKIGNRYSVIMEPAGLTIKVPGKSHQIAWWHINRVELTSQQIRFWYENQRLLVVPERYLPTDCSAPSLVAKLNTLICDSRRKLADKNISPSSNTKS